MIVDRIEDLIRGDYKPTQDQHDLAWAMGVVWGTEEPLRFKQYFMEQGGDDGDRPKVSGSSPFYCPKRVWFKRMGTDEETPAPRTYTAWYLGRVIENMVARQITLASEQVAWPKLVDGTLIEYECKRTVHGDELYGHVDLVIEHPDYGMVPVEVKSHADFGYRKVKRENQIPQTFGHLGQLQWYMTAMGATKGVYVAVSKSTGHSHEIWTDPDPALMQEYDEAYLIAKGVQPPRPAWAITKNVKHKRKGAPTSRLVSKVSDIRCGYCPFSAACWPTHHRETNEKGQPAWVAEVTA